MNDIDDLIRAADQLCATLDHVILQEKRFGQEVCLMLEHINHSIFCSTNDLKTIQYQMGLHDTGTEI